MRRQTGPVGIQVAFPAAGGDARTRQRIPRGWRRARHEAGRETRSTMPRKFSNHFQPRAQKQLPKTSVLRPQEPICESWKDKRRAVDEARFLRVLGMRQQVNLSKKKKKMKKRRNVETAEWIQRWAALGADGPLLIGRWDVVVHFAVAGAALDVERRALAHRALVRDVYADHV